jgi:hypothetical protein
MFRHSYYAPTLTAHGYLFIFDSRTATHDSDSTQTYPSDPYSEDDIPGYWPEHQPETPPNPNSPPHAAITDEQFADWIDSRLPWNDFRRSIPAFKKHAPPKLCGLPIIHRPFPNYQYMHNTQDPTANPLDASTCISQFHRSGQSWSQYINTFPPPPLLRRHYCSTPHSSTTSLPNKSFTNS